MASRAPNARCFVATDSERRQVSNAFECGLSCRIDSSRAVILRNMSEVPQISIIIAAYNDWNALRDCLQSIADQERPPRFEVLVIDDGSDQLVPETILRESKKLSMRILRQNHVGIADARNRGIQL